MQDAHSPYTYQLELFTLEGASIGRAAITADWEPAREWTRFTALRAGRVSLDAIDAGAVIQPVWHPKAGAPHVDGLRVEIAVENGEPISHVFGVEYFSRLAHAALQTLMERQGLKDVQKVRYVTTAYPAVGEPAARTTPLFQAKEIGSRLALQDGTLQEFDGRARPNGDAEQGDIPVFVPARVLDEAAALTGTAGANETGGILIGHLHRDRQGGEVFAEVTAQVPARHTEATSTSLTFTADTWTDVRNAIALRAQNELMLGWWHSHPVREWCKACPLERQRTCSLAAGFLSAHDRALHRTIFPRAFGLALLANDVAVDGPTFSMFGWREGQLERRGFSVLDERQRTSAAREPSERSGDPGAPASELEGGPAGAKPPGEGNDARMVRPPVAPAEHVDNAGACCAGTSK